MTATARGYGRLMRKKEAKRFKCLEGTRASSFGKIFIPVIAFCCRSKNTSPNRESGDYPFIALIDAVISRMIQTEISRDAVAATRRLLRRHDYSFPRIIIIMIAKTRFPGRIAVRVPCSADDTPAIVIELLLDYDLSLSLSLSLIEL